MSTRAIGAMTMLGAVTILGRLAWSDAYAQQPGANATPERYPPIHLPLPPMHLPPTTPQGSPAITPHIAGTPSITLDDVRQFVTTHPLLRPASRDTEPRYVRAQFLSSEKVSMALNKISTGFPNDYLLCLVELQGPFAFSGPPGAAAVYERGVLVFDARTGNLVISGGLP